MGYKFDVSKPNECIIIAIQTPQKRRLSIGGAKNVKTDDVLIFLAIHAATDECGSFRSMRSLARLSLAHKDDEQTKLPSVRAALPSLG